MRTFIGMKIIDIQQNWSGHFTYAVYDDKGNASDKEEKRIAFKIVINLHNGTFTGTSIDEESKHLFNEPVTVKGFIEKNLMSFTMQYPFLYYINEQGELATDREQEHPKIRYTGFFNDTKDEIVGEWEMGETPGEGQWGEFELKKR